MNCGAHSLEDLLVTRKSNPALLGHHLVADPDRELTGLSADGFDVNTEFLLQQRRYPSSARRIGRSNQAMPDDDFHIKKVYSRCPSFPLSRPAVNI
jgi:hypothetical protein